MQHGGVRPGRVRRAGAHADRTRRLRRRRLAVRPRGILRRARVRGATERPRPGRGAGPDRGGAGQPAEDRRLGAAASRGHGRAGRRAAGRHRHVPRRHHVPQPAPRPGPALPVVAALGVGRPGAAAQPGRVARRAARRRRRGGGRDDGADQPGLQEDPPRTGRRPDRVCDAAGAGLQESAVADGHQHAELHGVVVRRRRDLRVRVPPPRTAGVTERRRAGAVDAQEPASRDRAARAHRPLPAGAPGDHAPRPRGARGIGVQLGDVARGDLHRR